MSRWLVAILAALMIVPAWAQRPEAPPAREDVLRLAQRSAPLQPGPRISLAQATRIALQQFPGRVVRAETVRGEHHVRILGDDGRVRNVRVDARSGQVY